MGDVELVELVVLMFVAALVLGLLIFAAKAWILSKVLGRSGRVSEIERRIEELERERERRS